MKWVTLFFAVGLLCMGCAQNEAIDMEAARESILETDKAFSVMSVKEGMRPAFDHYMADSATIYQNGAEPTTGRENILPIYPAPEDQKGTLSWEPFHADIAESGDLGYSLGEWKYHVTDSLGAVDSAYGYYVTIWKEQDDGSWKFVFDTGVEGPQPDEEILDEVPEE